MTRSPDTSLKESSRASRCTPASAYNGLGTSDRNMTDRTKRGEMEGTEGTSCQGKGWEGAVGGRGGFSVAKAARESRVWLPAKVSVQGLESVHSPLITLSLGTRKKEPSTDRKFIFLACSKNS